MVSFIQGTRLRCPSPGRCQPLFLHAELQGKVREMLLQGRCSRGCSPPLLGAPGRLCLTAGGLWGEEEAGGSWELWGGRRCTRSSLPQTVRAEPRVG